MSGETKSLKVETPFSAAEARIAEEEALANKDAPNGESDTDYPPGCTVLYIVRFISGTKSYRIKNETAPVPVHSSRHKSISVLLTDVADDFPEDIKSVSWEITTDAHNDAEYHELKQLLLRYVLGLT